MILSYVPVDLTL